jgi:hypothetical protein
MPSLRHNVLVKGDRVLTTVTYAYLCLPRREPNHNPGHGGLVVTMICLREPKGKAAASKRNANGETNRLRRSDFLRSQLFMRGGRDATCPQPRQQALSGDGALQWAATAS